MHEIELTAKQAKAIDLAVSEIELRDPSGAVVARIPAPTESEIVERIRRQKALNLPTYPAAKVEAWFARLERLAVEVSAIQLMK